MFRPVIRLLFSVFLSYTAGTACYAQLYNDLIITEIMVDPTPAIGLPPVEYLELYNRSGKTIALKNWTLVMGSRKAVFPDIGLESGQYLLLCQAADVGLFENVSVCGLNTFSLTNEGSVLSLYRADHKLIFSLSYQLNWWETEFRDGGYALEMLDVDNPCGESENWGVSASASGGTPGLVNSRAAPNNDTTPPKVLRADVSGPTELILVANEKLDSLNAVLGAEIMLTGKRITARALQPPAFKNLKLTFDTPLLKTGQYQLTVRNLADCEGNLLRETSIEVGLPSEADSGDVVINEILFNPRPGGSDFVELYNRSSKFIDLQDWSLGNIRDGKPDVIRSLTTDHFMFAPHAYLVLATDVNGVTDFYQQSGSAAFIEMSLPSFSDAEGGVVLMDKAKRLFDRFDYNEQMYDPLIREPEGVSLEKVDFEKASDLPGNWHSAAATSGGATPGYLNSQIRNKTNVDVFTVEPEVFIPENDGDLGYAKINFQLTSPGRIGTIRIFDINGRYVRNLLNNQLIGTHGTVLWDGKTDSGTIVNTGYYLIWIECFDQSGNSVVYKRKVVVLKNK